MQLKVNQAVEYIKSKINFVPNIAVVLGSGLGDFAETVEDKVIIPYEDIPNFPRSTVQGHQGRFVFGKISRQNVCVMQGRVHYYEGYPMHEVVFPEYVMAGLGVKTLILTNAVGGMNENFKINSLVCIKDHINFTGYNPLIGAHYSYLGTRFISLNNLYDKGLREIAQTVAKCEGITLHEGVFVQTMGPSYESPAEIRAFKNMGADTCGMSTAVEAIAGSHAGMKILAISNVSNVAAGLTEIEPTHGEVLENSQAVKGDFQRLLNKIIEKINFKENI